MGCFVVASSFPVPLEYPAGTLRVQTYYQGTPKVLRRYLQGTRKVLETSKKSPANPDKTGQHGCPKNF